MKRPFLLIGIILLVIAIILGIYTLLPTEYLLAYSKDCVNDNDCVVFGETGVCNCGCFNKDYKWESGGECFCAAPISCKCVENKCEGIFEINSFEDCVKAGYPVMESYPRQCRANDKTFTEENCQSEGNILTLANAKQIAIDSECGDRLIIQCSCPEGYVKEGNACNPECYYSEPKCLTSSVSCQKTYMCNEYTGTWWIDLDIEREGCNPACVINVETRQAEINWRCTGLIS